MVKKAVAGIIVSAVFLKFLWPFSVLKAILFGATNLLQLCLSMFYLLNEFENIEGALYTLAKVPYNTF